MRRLAALALLMLILSGCRGGGLVFKGTHESQDKALLSKLGERYPDMGFECTGRAEGSVHTVRAADGTEFPAWTAAKSRGEFQVMEYYLEEWLAEMGYYDRIESRFDELGCSYEYGDYNHYGRHLRLLLGPLDSEEQLQKAAKAVSFAKAEFDSLRQDFEDSTGCSDLLLYFHGSYTLDGGEHFGMFYMSMRERDLWDREYPFDDYESCLRDYIDKLDETPDID